MCSRQLLHTGMSLVRRSDSLTWISPVTVLFFSLALESNMRVSVAAMEHVALKTWEKHGDMTSVYSQQEVLLFGHSQIHTHTHTWDGWNWSNKPAFWLFFQFFFFPPVFSNIFMCVSRTLDAMFYMQWVKPVRGVRARCMHGINVSYLTEAASVRRTLSFPLRHRYASVLLLCLYARCCFDSSDLPSNWPFHISGVQTHSLC